MGGLTNQTFSNRRTPPTDADFAAPPGINPGRRLPDWFYMDDDAPGATPPVPVDFTEPEDPSNFVFEA